MAVIGYTAYSLYPLRDAPSYCSSAGKADRMRTIDEFKADNNKLLNEEMHYAAERTVDAFIEHLRQSK